MRANTVTVGAGDVGYSIFSACHPDPDAPDIDDLAERLQVPGAPLDPLAPENIALAIGEQIEGQTPWVDACDQLQTGNEHEFCRAARGLFFAQIFSVQLLTASLRGANIISTTPPVQVSP